MAARVRKRPSPAQMRALALVCHYADRGGTPVDDTPGRPDTYLSLWRRRLIRRQDRETLSIWMPTALGLLVLISAAADDAFGLEIDPAGTIQINPILVHFRGRGKGRAILLIDRGLIRLDLGIDIGNSFFAYWSATIDRSGTCTVPGSPEGGFARLLDLAVDAGLELPEVEP